MTSPITEKHTQTGINLYNNNNNNNESILSSYSSPGNLSFAHCNNNIGSNESSNLITLSMINQALNLNLMPPNHAEKLSISPLQFPEIQKMLDNKTNNAINPTLMAEYQRIKQVVDKSGLLSPNENLVTKNRGDCYWSNCYFQSDIEETFKKHLTDCHQLTSSALAQLEISLEKSLQLSGMLVKEQNQLYNMMQHLDQKLKCLPNDSSTIADFHYLSLLLNKFKQTSPSMFELPSDQTRLPSSDMSSLHVSQPLPSYTNNQLMSLHQHSPTVNKPIANFSQQLIDNFSSALLRQQPLSVPSQNTNYSQQPVFSTCHVTQPNHTFNANVLPNLKSDPVNSNATFSLITNNSRTSPLTGIGNPSHQLNNIENNTNIKDILSQSRSSDSNYPLSDSAISTHIKDKKPRSLRRTSSGDNGQQLSNNMTDREYYRQFPVRPSASYVNLIKTAILESTRRELSLNEIYVWMQTEFAYFRDKEQKWKNAIRHNLSLHKCFQRKHGKLWTFNEKEYNLKKSRNRFQYNVPISGSEVPNNAGDCDDDYEDEDEHNEDNENPDSVIKKEMDYNDENVPDDRVLHNDEWSTYLHKNSLKSNSSTIDNLSLLPSIRTDRCPTVDN